MDLDDATRDELAAFFARRFPTAAERSELAQESGLTDPGGPDARAAWSALLDAAGRKNALALLAEAAVATAPGDPNLQEVCRILAGQAPPPRRFPVPALVGGMIVLGWVGIAAWSFGGAPAASGPDGAHVAAAPASSVIPSVVPRAAPGVPPEPSATPSEPVGAAASEPVAAAPPVAPVAPAAAAQPVAPVAAAQPVAPVAAAPPVAPVAAAPSPPPAAVAAPATTPSSAPPTVPSGGGRRPIPAACQGPAGTPIGYWYAGKSSPGPVGSDIVLPTAVNIRVDYPHAENGYAMHGRVLCAVAAGTHQHLGGAPIDIGGTWWVPVAGGELTER
jgi:hypothetical protein